MVDIDDLIAIFNNIKEEELEKGFKVNFSNEDNIFKYDFENIHFVFLNKVTLAFNQVKLDNNLRFYIDNQAIGAIDILAIEEIYQP